MLGIDATLKFVAPIQIDEVANIMEECGAYQTLLRARRNRVLRALQRVPRLRYRFITIVPLPAARALEKRANVIGNSLALGGVIFISRCLHVSLQKPKSRRGTSPILLT